MQTVSLKAGFLKAKKYTFFQKDATIEQRQTSRYSSALYIILIEVQNPCIFVFETSQIIDSNYFSKTTPASCKNTLDLQAAACLQENDALSNRWLEALTGWRGSKRGVCVWFTWVCFQEKTKTFGTQMQPSEPFLKTPGAFPEKIQLKVRAELGSLHPLLCHKSQERAVICLRILWLPQCPKSK